MARANHPKADPVPLSDKRQTMNVSDAKNEFNEIMED